MHPSSARSYLFVPGNRPERFSSARASQCDVVIVDLEDAIANDSKDSARHQVSLHLSADAPVYLRINGSSTPWFHADLELASHPGVCGIVYPKAERCVDLDLIREIAGEKPLLPMIETAVGFDNARLLGQHPAVTRLVFGSYDFMADIGISSNGIGLLYFRSNLVLASRLAGLCKPVDGINVQYKDETRLRKDALVSARLGFGGKLCIHPAQVAVVNECFGPSLEELNWAREVLDAFKTGGGGAIALDGKMIDKPVVLQAERILQLAEGNPKPG